MTPTDPLWRRSAGLAEARDSRPVVDLRSAFEVTEPSTRDQVRAVETRKQLGIRFERQVQRELLRTYPQAKLNQWFFFRDANGPGKASPDVIIPFPEHTLVVEIKRSHTPRAWFQLRWLYSPIVEAALGKPVTIVEIVHSLNHIAFPEPIRLVHSVRELAELRSASFWVMPWRQRDD